MPADAALDHAIAEAWPARLTEVADGWTRRFADGVTRRGNSVFVAGAPQDLDAAIAGAERFYREAGQPACFLVSEASAPVAVVEGLRTRGWRPSVATWVLSLDDLSSSAPSDGWTLATSAQPDDRWFATYWSGSHEGRPERDADVLRQVLLQPSHPASFVAAIGDGEAESVGQMVLVDGIGCVQCLVTRPQARRRGAGRAVVDALISGARESGATRLVAAVMEDNEPSLALFARLGFERSHRYRYFVEKSGP